MNIRLWTAMAWLLAGVLTAHPAPSWGADPDADLARAAKVVNEATTTPAGQQQVADRLAQKLNASCKCSAFSAASLSAIPVASGLAAQEFRFERRLRRRNPGAATRGRSGGGRRGPSG